MADKMKPIMADDFYLEQPSIEHIQSCFEAAIESVTDIYPWMDWCHPEITEAEIAKLIEEDINAWQTGDYYAFMILDSSTSEVIGQVVVNHINRTHNFANLGYWIKSSRTGLGIASRASLLLRDIVLRPLDCID